jgi:predicted nucleic acid-binding protein
MNVVDSSAWLEYFANGPNASFFTPPIEDLEELIVPSITIYEVFKRVLQQRDEGQALQSVAAIEQSTVVELDAGIAVNAARISVELKIPMADSIVLATARVHGATVWTQDEDFRDLPNVQYRRRKT